MQVYPSTVGEVLPAVHDFTLTYAADVETEGFKLAVNITVITFSDCLQLFLFKVFFKCFNIRSCISTVSALLMDRVSFFFFSAVPRFLQFLFKL